MGSQTEHGGASAVPMDEGGPTVNRSTAATADGTGWTTDSSSVRRKLGPRVQQRVRLYPRVRRSPAVGLPPLKRVRPQTSSARPVQPVTQVEASTGPEAQERSELSVPSTASPTITEPATAPDPLEFITTTDPDASTATAQTLSKQLSAIVHEHGAALRHLLQMDVANTLAHFKDDSKGLKHMDNAPESKTIRSRQPSGSSLTGQFQDANEDSPHVSHFSSLDLGSALPHAQVATTSSPSHVSSSGSLGLSQLPVPDDSNMDGGSNPDEGDPQLGEVSARLITPITEHEHSTSTGLESTTERAATPMEPSALTPAPAPQPANQVALRPLQSPAQISNGERYQQDEVIHADGEISTSERELELNQGSDTPSAPLCSPLPTVGVRSPELPTSRLLALRQTMHPRDRSRAPSALVDPSGTSSAYDHPSSPSVLSPSVSDTGWHTFRSNTRTCRSGRRPRSRKIITTIAHGPENVEPDKSWDQSGHATVLSRTSGGAAKERSLNRSPLVESNLYNRMSSSPQTTLRQVQATPPAVASDSLAGPPLTSTTAGSAHDEAPSAPTSSVSRAWSVQSQGSSQGVAPRGSTPAPIANRLVPDAASAQLHAFAPQDSY